MKNYSPMLLAIHPGLELETCHGARVIACFFYEGDVHPDDPLRVGTKPLEPADAIKVILGLAPWLKDHYNSNQYFCREGWVVGQDTPERSFWGASVVTRHRDYVEVVVTESNLFLPEILAKLRTTIEKYSQGMIAKWSMPKKLRRKTLVRLDGSFELPQLRRYPPPNPGEWLEKIVEHFGVTRELLLGSIRLPKISFARHVLEFLLRQYTLLSYKQIGDLLHKDHTSVIHGEGVIKDRLANDQTLRNELLVIIAKVDEVPTD